MAKVGRPRTDTAPVMVRMSPELLHEIDAYRRTQDDLPSRPEVVRRALAEWFARQKKQSGPPEGGGD